MLRQFQIQKVSLVFLKPLKKNLVMLALILGKLCVHGWLKMQRKKNW